LGEEQFQKEFQKLTAKECLCNGLSTSVMHINQIERKMEHDGVSICPGPNLAYYSKISSLLDMTKHIYGKSNIMQRSDRPNMFIKELGLYVDYLQNKFNDAKNVMDKKQERYFGKFIKNMEEGITYYQNLFETKSTAFSKAKNELLTELDNYSKKLLAIRLEMQETLVS